MEYLSCSDASKAMGFSVRRIQQMCKNGELPGAIKEGRKWLIPDETIHMNHFAKNKSLPIGVSDFKLATTGYYYVDKTLMIRDFLDKKPMVSLFTRPRRFGKTLNMDMLRVFLKKQTKIHLFISKTNRYGNAAITTLNTKDSILSFFDVQRCQKHDLGRNLSENP